MKGKIFVFLLILVLAFSLMNISSAAGSLKIQMYNSGVAATTSTINPVIRLTNQSTSAISLSTVTIRYYYTIDGDKAQNYYCDYSVMNPGNTVQTSNVTGKYVKMSTAVTGADYYLEIGFAGAAGSLAANATLDIQSRIAKTDWTNYTQTGDYSFNSSATSLVDWNYVTAYVSGALQWGTEPGGATPVPTTTPVPGTPIPTPNSQISSLVINDTTNAANWSIQTNLQVGNAVYGDRTVLFAQIPAKYLGADWIRTACDSKSYIGELGSFTTNSNVSVYVGLDSRVTTIPAWLSAWTFTGESVTGDNDVIFNLYKEDFNSGSIVRLGENGQSAGAVHYTVIVTPYTPDGATPSSRPTSTQAPTPATVTPTATPTPIRTVTPTATPTLAPNEGQYIRSLVINDTTNAANWSIQTNLQVGNTIYGDRTVLFAQIPAKYLGADLIRTACDSKSYTGEVGNFTTKSYVSVYVGLDSRVTTIPAWLSTWMYTGESVTGDNDVTFNLYKEDFNSGTIVRLGENGQSSGAVHYTVIVTPYTPDGPTPTATRRPTPTPTPRTGLRQMENLDRGVVAVKVSNGVFVSWRVLGNESSNVSYNLYRGSTKVNPSPLTVSNYVDTAGTTSSTYTVRAVVDGSEQGASPSVNTWGSNYLSIPLQIPAGGSTPDGVSYTYSANDCSTADLDGDHQYEIIVKWDPSNAKDNSQSGYTGNVYLDAYKMNGTRLWRIDLGRNIRAGAHYTQFMVYDLDGDGKAEVACKTADGTKDGKGTVIGSSSADYRNSSGYILSGPEYLTIFNGQTGAALTTINYEPARGTVSSWGDSYGNRVDRFLACIAYLDGIRPSLVMCRGYYTRAVLVAYNWRNGSLSKVWTFDSNSSGNSGYAGQGNHNLSVGDVDADGKDEIVYGSCTINDNGTGLYNTGLGHGDAMHLGDFDPDRAGLEVWQCHEGGSGATFRDARTGAVIFKYDNSGDVGRACVGDVTASYRGVETWASGSSLYSCKGANAGSRPSPVNFAIWWDGDLLRELLDGTTISKYGGSNLLSVSDCSSNNGTKSTPCLTADLLGDWREEVVFRTTDSSALRIYTTTTVTSTRLFTLMHDPQYRLSVAWQNVAYNQPPHVGFYLGDGMIQPAMPKIYLAP